MEKTVWQPTPLQKTDPASPHRPQRLITGGFRANQDSKQDAFTGQSPRARTTFGLYHDYGGNTYSTEMHL